MKIWIEMSRDIEHGGNEWGFTKCIWAPTYKKGKLLDILLPKQMVIELKNAHLLQVNGVIVIVFIEQS